MMNKNKAVFAILVFLAVSLLITAAIGENSTIVKIPELGMAVPIPSGYYAFARNMPSDDPALLLFGYTASQVNQILAENNMYMDAVNAAGNKEISVTMIGSTLGDFSNYQDGTLLFLTASIMENIKNTGVIVDQYDVFHAKEAKYVRFREHRPDIPNLDGLQYMTTVNSQAINITFINFTGSITPEEEKLFDSTVYNTSFSERPESADVPEFYENAADFQYGILDNGTAKITGYTGRQANIAIPSSINGVEVSEIGCWGDNSSVTAISIPASVVSMDGNPFSDLSALQYIAVKEENASFSSVDGILYTKSVDRLICYPANRPNEQFVIPETVKVIGEKAFRDCDHLKSVIFPNGLETIEKDSFETSDNISEIILPQTVSLIEGNPFKYAFGLKNIAVDPANPYYSSADSVLFETGSRKLVCYPHQKNEAEYTVPDGIQIIGEGAFLHNAGATVIHFPETLIEVQDWAFDFCTGFQFPELTGHLKRIGDFAFSECKTIAKLTVSAEIEYVGTRAFGNCDSLTELIIEDGVEEISMAEFLECRNLQTVVIPDSVKRIGDYAFRYCSGLTSVTIPSTVLDIGESAFEHCPSLVVTVTPGSYAESYCKTNGLKWIAADAENTGK